MGTRESELIATLRELLADIEDMRSRAPIECDDGPEHWFGGFSVGVDDLSDEFMRTYVSWPNLSISATRARAELQRYEEIQR
jgi:hypothetical protein